MVLLAAQPLLCPKMASQSWVAGPHKALHMPVLMVGDTEAFAEWEGGFMQNLALKTAGESPSLPYRGVPCQPR